MHRPSGLSRQRQSGSWSDSVFKVLGSPKPPHPPMELPPPPHRPNPCDCALVPYGGSKTDKCHEDFFPNTPSRPKHAGVSVLPPANPNPRHVTGGEGGNHPEQTQPRTTPPQAGEASGEGVRPHRHHVCILCSTYYPYPSIHDPVPHNTPARAAAVTTMTAIASSADAN